MNPQTSSDLEQVFAQLRRIMLPYAKRLICAADLDGHLSIDTSHIQKNKKPLWFGGVETKKNYVSFHLMPVYVNPVLLEGVSAGLRKRMQGKSCFNFASVDPALFEELAELTAAAYDDYERQGYA